MAKNIIRFSVPVIGHEIYEFELTDVDYEDFIANFPKTKKKTWSMFEEYRNEWDANIQSDVYIDNENERVNEIEIIFPEEVAK